MTRMLSWKPRLRGEVFCSSACGSNCKRAEYEWCKAQAAALAKRMGKGWKPRVWENMGWHYEVVLKNGLGSISPSITKKLGKLHKITGYRADLRLATDQWLEYGKTPEGAFIKARELAMRYVRVLVADLETLSGK